MSSRTSCRLRPTAGVRHDGTLGRDRQRAAARPADNAAVIEEQERLRRLVQAGILLTSELSLDAVLQRLIETAADLTGARYAALGVIAPSGEALERFLTTGIDEDQAREIGHVPVGRGILGVVIREAKVLRLHDIAGDPRSVGFPPGHPAMRTFLGVPILLRGVAYGNLYLTEKRDDADFTDADEEVAVALAAQAAVAIENARLYESATRWLRQLESLAEISDALVGKLELRPMLDLICSRLCELVRARSVFVALPSATGDLEIAAASDGNDIEHAVGLTVPVSSSKSGKAFLHRQTYRVDSFLDDPEIDHRAHGALLRACRGARAESGYLRAADRPRPGDRGDRGPRPDRRRVA